MKRPAAVIEVGDRIRFDGGVHVLAGLDGQRYRLVAEEGARTQDFAVLDPPPAGAAAACSRPRSAGRA